MPIPRRVPRRAVRGAVLALLLTALAAAVPQAPSGVHPPPGPDARAVRPPNPAAERTPGTDRSLGTDRSPTDGRPAGPAGTTPAEPTPTERTTPVPTTESLLLAGRRVVYSYSGAVPPPELLRTISAGRAAGVILFKDNVATPPQLQAAIAQLRQAAAAAPSGSPLLLMTDQEGGKVRRINPGEPELSARATGAAADPAGAAAHAGAGAARTLRDAGLNVNLAPVLDVFDTPDNFIDHSERSYSRNPAVVAELGSAFLRAQQALGVLATAKHFPGLGAAAREENTDERPVILSVPLSDLRARGEEPYRAAIAAGVRLVMTSWAVYPALDAYLPAGLSRTIVQGELRERLGFDGVTVTDALEAGALKAFGDVGDRAVAAADAGMDLLLCSARDVRQGDAAVEALATALDSGRLDATAFGEAVHRVDGLRASLASGS
ncbi:glycoside hydrolase family 3 N-terminal domain-containing protein [Kitasatospora sp. NPDC093806]|uniref:glycoside hydrolase family 3 N-terminal domain-containing protein n=1 Tax=Kitasatospora sp. NPDC093806 TaxID=3155075 RepID=UPI003439602C